MLIAEIIERGVTVALERTNRFRLGTFELFDVLLADIVDVIIQNPLASPSHEFVL